MAIPLNAVTWARLKVLLGSRGLMFAGSTGGSSREPLNSESRITERLPVGGRQPSLPHRSLSKVCTMVISDISGIKQLRSIVTPPWASTNDLVIFFSLIVVPAGTLAGPTYSGKFSHFKPCGASPVLVAFNFQPSSAAAASYFTLLSVLVLALFRFPALSATTPA